MTPVDPVRFGYHDAMLQQLQERMGNVEDYCATMNAKLDTLLLQRAEAKGGVRVAAWFGGMVAGGLVSVLVAVVTRWLQR